MTELSEQNECITVSIIINNYNYSKYLKQAIESSLAQTYKHVETIVVDDGSTDDSAHIIKQYQSELEAILKKNGGQASALNKGFASSTGKLVIFLDSDDYLFPNAVENVVKAYGPGVVNIQYRLQSVDATGKKLGLHPSKEKQLCSGNVLPDLLNQGRYIWQVTSGNAFCRDALDKIMPIPEQEFITEADGYLHVLMPLLGLIASIDSPLGAYRKHDSNAWQISDTIDKNRFHKSAAKDFNKFKYFRQAYTEQAQVAPKDIALRNFACVITRLASLRLTPEQHPIASDSRLGLVRAGLKSIWKYSKGSGSWKLATSIWIILVGSVPQEFCEQLISWRLVSESRPQPMVWLKKHLG